MPEASPRAGIHRIVLTGRTHDLVEKIQNPHTFSVLYPQTYIPSTKY